jgi:PmbA protein
LVAATSGGALYRKASFLLDSLGTRVLPEHVDVTRTRMCARARAAHVRRRRRAHARARASSMPGVLQGYFLSSYSARKLGLKTTGHAGGSQNLTLTSRLTTPGDDLPAMIRRLRRGLFVTELMGQGVNGVTGDYSRGAAGFWVEDGASPTRCRRSPSPATCGRCSRTSPGSAPTPMPRARARSVRC